jgi:hypothetical protein
MKSVKRLAGLSLAMGLLMVGCGGPVTEPEQEAASLETREDALPDCSDPGALYTEYYSDATYTSVVGGKGCSCGAYISWGNRTSPYRQYFTNDACM